jgi:hypothetical protein
LIVADHGTTVPGRFLAVPLASQYGQVAAGAIFLGSDAELPLGIHVEGDVDQRLARAGRRDLRHLEQAEPLVEGDQLALTLKGPELDG